MFQFSQVISLPVINIYNARIEGVVENICVNKSLKIEYLIIYDNETDSYKSMSPRDIFAISESAVFIKNLNKITLYENNELKINECYTPMNSNVYIVGGEYIGKINNMSFDKNGYIKTLYIDNASIDSSRILTLSNKLTLIKNNRYHKLSQFSPRSTKITKLIPVNDSPVITILNSPSSTLPQREMTNHSFLLNRQILKNIKNYNGEVLAKQNTIVTQSIIDKLKRYGKLKELILNSK